MAEVLGAVPRGTERQRDTFFNCRAGRLKLREKHTDRGTMSELIAYQRADAAGPRGSDYTVVPIADPEPVRQLLATALGVRSEVRKRRTVYLHDNVRIHLDEVEELGSFLEFEAIVDGPCGDAEARAKVDRLIAEFGIAQEHIIPQAYEDLLRQ